MTGMKDLERDESARLLKMDDTSISTDPELPAFLAKPDGAPVYHGFPIVPETMTDEWCLGVITEYEDPNGCDAGDAYVVAPDGSRAGLVWDVGDGKLSQICPPDEERWGVYQVWFSKPVRTTDDLVARFREILPQLQEVFDRLRPNFH